MPGTPDPAIECAVTMHQQASGSHLARCACGWRSWVVRYRFDAEAQARRHLFGDERTQRPCD